MEKRRLLFQFGSHKQAAGVSPPDSRQGIPRPNLPQPTCTNHSPGEQLQLAHGSGWACPHARVRVTPLVFSTPVSLISPSLTLTSISQTLPVAGTEEGQLSLSFSLLAFYPVPVTGQRTTCLLRQLTQSKLSHMAVCWGWKRTVHLGWWLPKQLFQRRITAGSGITLHQKITDSKITYPAQEHTHFKKPLKPSAAFQALVPLQHQTSLLPRTLPGETHSASLTPSRCGALCCFEEGPSLWMNDANSPGFVLMQNWEDF